MSAPDVIGDACSPYLLTDEAARYCRFDRATNGEPRSVPESMRMFREWAARKNIKPCQGCRILRWDRRVLDAFLRGEPWTKRHADHDTRRLKAVPVPNRDDSRMR